MFDVAIVGGGPAGTTCAALCAQAGLRTVLLEREFYPREKVCGDCLNPACWPILQRLQLVERVLKLPHGLLERVEFVGIDGRSLKVTFPSGQSEIAVKRSLFDELIMTRARDLGAAIFPGTIATAITRPSAADRNWKIVTADHCFEAPVLVAADGRNSTVARLCHLLPPSAKDRVALQTHLPLPRDFGDRVVLQFRPEGYSGQAPVGQGQLNLCLVSVPRNIGALRSWAEAEFGLPPEQPWRTTTPLTRGPIAAAQPMLFFAGDAARVVEPFTGEGIYYALASGALAADAIISQHRGRTEREVTAAYCAAHAELYRGRLWINRLARAAILSPRTASVFLAGLRFQPALLRYLTARIVS